MSLLSRYRQRWFAPKSLPAGPAYDQWAADYDAQPGNLVMKLDAELFDQFLNRFNPEGKSIADIGCGTGRHWGKLVAAKAGSITGFDVSAGMLEKLKDKFPDARVFQSDGSSLNHIPDAQYDAVISTLTLAHLENPAAAFPEWNRVLKPVGWLYITDFHPAILARGGQRSFKKNGKTFVVKNHMHETGSVRQWALQSGFMEMAFTEKHIDDTVRSFYASQNALHLFEAFKGEPLVYALLLKKTAMMLQQVSLFEQPGPVNISIAGERIRAIVPATGNQPEAAALNCQNLLALPGFINSHEHLDFNLYPQLGNGPYANYTEWGKDIHKRYRNIIQEIQKIPESLRAQWGFYKNLLNGFTTVINHGKRIKEHCSFLDVYENMTVLHSTAFEKNWKWKLNNPFHLRRKVCMHIGEGTDAFAASEPALVSHYNFLRRPLVAVHGVGMNRTTAAKYKALVWCPASNHFLLGKTAPVAEISRQIPVVFGTDSTLTSSWNLWDHLRMAKASAPVSDTELIYMLTKTPASVWETNGSGLLTENAPADVILMDLNDQPFTAAHPGQIMLIIKKGRIVYIDGRFLKKQSQLELNLNQYDKIILNETTKYVPAGIRTLTEEIKKHYPAVKFPFTYES